MLKWKALDLSIGNIGEVTLLSKDGVSKGHVRTKGGKNKNWAGRNRQHCHDGALVQRDQVLLNSEVARHGYDMRFQEQEDASASRDPCSFAPRAPSPRSRVRPNLSSWLLMPVTRTIPCCQQLSRRHIASLSGVHIHTQPLPSSMY